MCVCIVVARVLISVSFVLASLTDEHLFSLKSIALVRRVYFYITEKRKIPFPKYFSRFLIYIEKKAGED